MRVDSELALATAGKCNFKMTQVVKVTHETELNANRVYSERIIYKANEMVKSEMCVEMFTRMLHNIYLKQFICTKAFAIYFAPSCRILTTELLLLMHLQFLNMYIICSQPSQLLHYKYLLTNIITNCYLNANSKLAFQVSFRLLLIVRREIVPFKWRNLFLSGSH